MIKPLKTKYKMSEGQVNKLLWWVLGSLFIIASSSIGLLYSNINSNYAKLETKIDTLIAIQSEIQSTNAVQDEKINTLNDKCKTSTEFLTSLSADVAILKRRVGIEKDGTYVAL